MDGTVAQMLAAVKRPLPIWIGAGRSARPIPPETARLGMMMLMLSPSILAHVVLTWGERRIGVSLLHRGTGNPLIAAPAPP
jgi:hypothetical protein